ARFDRASRYTATYHVRWQVARYDRSCADNASFADNGASSNDGVGTNPYAVANHDVAFVLRLESRRSTFLQAVIRGGDNGSRSDHDVIAKGYATSVIARPKANPFANMASVSERDSLAIRNRYVGPELLVGPHGDLPLLPHMRIIVVVEDPQRM